jgi:D-glycero-D-manno-heptose 1,7-bisphosphate phosphatase
VKDAIFFERDGILNLCETDRGHQVVPMRLDQFRINPVAIEMLPQLKEAGFVLIATTNQPAVSEGKLSRRELDLMHAMLRRKLPLDDIMICPYDDRTHPCCKPQPGMFLEAGFKWSLDLDHSFVVSDKWPDAKAAQIAGCTSVMVQSPWIGKDHHDFVVPDLPAAVRKILELHQNLHGYALAASA